MNILETADEVVSMINTAGAECAAQYLHALYYAGIIDRQSCRAIVAEVNKTTTKIRMK